MHNLLCILTQSCINYNNDPTNTFSFCCSALTCCEISFRAWFAGPLTSFVLILGQWTKFTNHLGRIIETSRIALHCIIRNIEYKGKCVCREEWHYYHKNNTMYAAIMNIVSDYNSCNYMQSFFDCFNGCFISKSFL